MKVFVAKYKVIYGGFSRGAHLFPFRTQKLSPLAPMVLRERESRSPPVFIFEPLFLSFDRKRGFFVFNGLGFLNLH